MKRRDFLRNSLVGLGAALGGGMPFGATLSTLAQEDVPGDDMMSLPVKGGILNVHDPVVIKHEDYYYLYHTGTGIPIKRSQDMITWGVARGGNVFQSEPEPFEYVPGATNIWAPDISFWNDRYHLYYSVSTFGSSHSAIGLATNTTLNYDDEAYEWVDHGIVIKSSSSSNWNAIDPNLVIDEDGEPWMVFGSHWSGIKMIKIDYETGLQSEEDTTLYDIASRAVHPRAIEAPFIIYREPWYYLFVSFDQCCSGINSTYNVRVGRSESVTGPYEDRDGVPMMEDGGTPLLWWEEGRGRYRGPGHNGIFTDDGQDYIVYHAYDAVQGGTPTLRIDPLQYDEEGWPFVASMLPEADEDES